MHARTASGGGAWAMGLRENSYRDTPRKRASSKAAARRRRREELLAAAKAERAAKREQWPRTKAQIEASRAKMKGAENAADAKAEADRKAMPPPRARRPLASAPPDEQNKQPRPRRRGDYSHVKAKVSKPRKKWQVESAGASAASSGGWGGWVGAASPVQPLRRPPAQPQAKEDDEKIEQEVMDSIMQVVEGDATTEAAAASECPGLDDAGRAEATAPGTTTTTPAPASPPASECPGLDDAGRAEATAPGTTTTTPAPASPPASESPDLESVLETLAWTEEDERTPGPAPGPAPGARKRWFRSPAAAARPRQHLGWLSTELGKVAETPRSPGAVRRMERRLESLEERFNANGVEEVSRFLAESRDEVARQLAEAGSTTSEMRERLDRLDEANQALTVEVAFLEQGALGGGGGGGGGGDEPAELAQVRGEVAGLRERLGEVARLLERRRQDAEEHRLAREEAQRLRADLDEQRRQHAEMLERVEARMREEQNRHKGELTEALRAVTAAADEARREKDAQRAELDELKEKLARPKDDQPPKRRHRRAKASSSGWKSQPSGSHWGTVLFYQRALKQRGADK